MHTLVLTQHHVARNLEQNKLLTPKWHLVLLGEHYIENKKQKKLTVRVCLENFIENILKKKQQL